MSIYSGGEDTFSLQLLKAEVETALAEVQREDAHIQKLLEESGGF